MNELITRLALIQVALPTALVLANTLVPSASRLGLGLRSAAIAVLLVYAALAGVWLFPPWWTPYALIGALSLGTIYRWRRTPGARPAWPRWGEGLLATLALIGAMVLVVPALQGRAVPPGAIELAMPLGPGRYLVTSGGRTETVNAHLFSLTVARARGFRGQSHAVDIIGIDRLGLRAQGISPVDPQAYAIYGTPALAPCTGTAAMVITGVADMPVPQMDRDNMTGNSVMLECEGVFVLLAHLAPGSLAVRPGQTVATGDVIGRVGNSGNTGEPHLHIHVQKALPPDDPISADPLWFTLDGWFPVRNDRFTVAE